jgi:hypothetical protein
MMLGGAAYIEQAHDCAVVVCKLDKPLRTLCTIYNAMHCYVNVHCTYKVGTDILVLVLL